VAYYLLKELPRGIDAFDPRNPLIFAAGPLTGAAFSGQGRNGAGAKSPLTNGFGNAEGGGYWGAELKRAGLDGIVITGRADKATYLWLHDDQCEFRDAAHLWGKSTGETEDALRAELNDRLIRTALIGPAGENRVRFAAIVNDRSHFVGRNGLGAVMGSKNLKGIAVRAPAGKGKMEIFAPQGVQALSKWMGANLQEVARLHEHGTAGIMRGLHRSGGLPSYNFTQGHFDAEEKIDGQTMTATILTKRETCFACAVRCKRVVEVKESAHGSVDPLYGGPEYETLAAFGSMQANDDLIAIAKANELCAMYGMDTISLGVTIAFAIECFERGLITTQDTDGIELKRGNARAMLQMVEAITRRKGFGNVLAEGAARAAQQIGKGAEEFAMHVRGQEMPMHEPRLKAAIGLGYAISPTGADHNHNIHDTVYTKDVSDLTERDPSITAPLPANNLSADKVKFLVAESNWTHFWDSAVMCIFLPYENKQMVDVMNSVTGWDGTIQEYFSKRSIRDRSRDKNIQKIVFTRRRKRTIAKWDGMKMVCRRAKS
ncbi:MAG: aldehyde ferredoxin oxidoreductase, partial [Chloroflexi bacterium]|nr:aldehyde ferredoxin oxidoreductase [Chloroflexota bacterium]